MSNPTETTTTRPLEVRLAEYRDGVRALGKQAQVIVTAMALRGMQTESLQDIVDAFEIFAGDLTDILDGTEVMMSRAGDLGSKR